MKSRFIGVAAVILAGSLVCFGGQSAKVGMVGKSVEVSPADTKPAVQYGKGGMTRNETVLRGNAYRSQTAQDNGALTDQSAARHPGDAAYRK